MTVYICEARQSLHILLVLIGSDSTEPWQAAESEDQAEYCPGFNG